VYMLDVPIKAYAQKCVCVCERERERERERLCAKMCLCAIVFESALWCQHASLPLFF